MRPVFCAINKIYMGLIRLLLAFSVVIAHSNPVFGNKLIGGSVSVRAFFIISGFYMALILNEKYVSKDSYKLFITNRLLRLYPVYWVMLLLTIFLGFLAFYFSQRPVVLNAYFNTAGQISIFSWIYLLVSNLSFVGLDWLLFMGFNDTTGNFFFSSTQTGAWHFIVVPQAWSIGTELVFYLIAPFLVRRKVIPLLVIVGLSLMLRIFLYNQGLDKDPWAYRFFPTELAFFMVGALGYKAYHLLKTKTILPIVNWMLLALMLGFTVGYQYLALESTVKEWLYYTVIAIATPFVFLFTKNNKWDFRIGELTYPVYMCHIFIFAVLGYLNKFTGIGPAYSGLVTVVGSVLFSMVLVKYIVEPIENIRQRRVKQSKFVKESA
jgi:peptidoglycan/LPS O-acetylase OafA/YrhL